MGIPEKRSRTEKSRRAGLDVAWQRHAACMRYENAVVVALAHLPPGAPSRPSRRRRLLHGLCPRRRTFPYKTSRALALCRRRRPWLLLECAAAPAAGGAPMQRRGGGVKCQRGKRPDVPACRRGDQVFKASAAGLKATAAGKRCRPGPLC
jgi:hypothetical protein